MQTKEILYKGKRMVYCTMGSGPLVVLLHGFGEDGTIWKGQYDLFPDYQLLVPDLPGSGNSEPIEDMSMEGLAEAVKVMMEAELHASSNLAGKGTILIGHSMGGYITLAFAERYPERLRGFGLVHSTAFADSEEKKETRQKGIRFMQTHGASDFLEASIPNLYAPQTKEQYPEWIEEHLSHVHNFSADSLVSYYMSMMKRPDRTEVLKSSKVPVLFLIGRHDVAVPLEDSLKQCYLPQLSYIQILDQSGHMGMIEELNETNQILSLFIITIEKTALT